MLFAYFIILLFAVTPLRSWGDPRHGDVKIYHVSPKGIFWQYETARMLLSLNHAFEFEKPYKSYGGSGVSDREVQQGYFFEAEPAPRFLKHMTRRDNPGEESSTIFCFLFFSASFTVLSGVRPEPEDLSFYRSVSFLVCNLLREKAGRKSLQPRSLLSESRPKLLLLLWGHPPL